jgi:FimV-like protein
MSERHVTPWIADHVEGRSSPSERATIETHLAHCEECAADFAFARSLRADVEAARLRHLSSGRILALLQDRPETAERAHLDRCAECRRHLEWARELPADAAAALPIEAARAWLRRTLSSLRSWTGSQRSGDRPAPARAAADAATLRIALLARIEPLPVLVQRGSEREDARAWARGLELYREQSFAAAAPEFAKAVDLAPERAEILLYLGSSQVLLGRDEDGIQTLQRAVRLAGTDPPSPLLEECRWQLANAYLSIGDAATAAPILQEIAATGERHREDAARVTQSLAEIPGLHS